MAEMTPEAIAFLNAVAAEAKAAEAKGGSAAAVRNKYRAMDSSNKNAGKAKKAVTAYEDRGKKKKTDSDAEKRVVEPSKMDKFRASERATKPRPAGPPQPAKPKASVRENTLKAAAMAKLTSGDMVKTSKQFGSNKGREKTQQENLNKYGSISGAQPGDPQGKIHGRNRLNT